MKTEALENVVSGIKSNLTFGTVPKQNSAIAFVPSAPKGYTIDITKKKMISEY